MSKRSLGSLADLAKIMEAASDPNSELREDRKEPSKAGKIAPKRAAAPKPREVDPKRKAWYERRLREQAAKAQAAPDKATEKPAGPPPQAAARSAATGLGSGLMDTLAAAARETKEKAAKEGKEGKRPEAWRRKPGDPIF